MASPPNPTTVSTRCAAGRQLRARAARIRVLASLRLRRRRTRSCDGGWKYPPWGLLTAEGLLLGPLICSSQRLVFPASGGAAGDYPRQFHNDLKALAGQNPENTVAAELALKQAGVRLGASCAGLAALTARARGGRRSIAAGAYGHRCGRADPNNDAYACALTARGVNVRSRCRGGAAPGSAACAHRRGA